MLKKGDGKSSDPNERKPSEVSGGDVRPQSQAVSKSHPSR